ncbi:MAG: sirohydrochlorin cobaltochelatase [Deltaproteobacteria bacterium]|jgi:sirohydrochlorin cobaltochelatase|nr:sirohydrochlorin cobaltochelatase [Deltaproteobacteria bacterium]
MLKKMLLNLAMLSFLFLAFQVALVMIAEKASAFERTPQKPAIVLAAFGTTEVSAVNSILNIRDKVKAAFPDYDVHLAFTSNIIREIWHKRANDAAFKKENPNVPAELYVVKNALSVLADIQENGARLVLVQSLHVTDGEEYQDLANLVTALSKYETLKPVLKPFPWIGVGEPALGLKDGQPKYLDRAVTALAPLAEKAKASNSALVLMGHGNEHLTQKVFDKLQTALRKAYGPQVYVGTVEAAPQAEDIIAAIKATKDAPTKALLAPMMIVAGDHALNDMAGAEEDSWGSLFKAAGFETEYFLTGLGSNDSWANIYVEHLQALAPKVLAEQAKDNK